MFIQFCQSTGLNPFKKEIWFVKSKSYTRRDGVTVEGRVQMMTGINGFFQIANKNPNFDGMSEPEYEEKDGRPLKATVKVYRKDRKFPSVGVARWSEFFPGPTERKNSVWETKPFHMLAKIAKAIALREAFPQELNGLYTDDEYREEPIEIEAHPLDAIEPRKALPAQKLPTAKGETQKQAETRALMAAGQSYSYGSEFIQVEGVERKRLWAQLVKEHGAVTDEAGNIHTSTEAAVIDYALIGKPTPTATNETEAA
jgi:phage recombination protein Bet